MHGGDGPVDLVQGALEVVAVGPAQLEHEANGCLGATRLRDHGELLRGGRERVGRESTGKVPQLCLVVLRGGAVLVEDGDRLVFSQLPPDPDLDARHDLHLLVKGRSNHKSDADRGAVGWRKNQTRV